MEQCLLRTTRCRTLGITLSMGSVGDCFDNAMMESFFSSLEAEVLDRYRFQTREEARREGFTRIEGCMTRHVVIADSVMFFLESSNDDPVRNMRADAQVRLSRIRGRLHGGEDGEAET